MTLTLVPQSIQGEDEETAILAHALYQELLECVRNLDATFEQLSRIIYKFISQPRLVAAMGWTRPQDIFLEPEIQFHIDRMRITSPAQFFRWKRTAKIDSLRPEWGILGLKNLSRLNQDGKIGQLEALIEKNLPKEIEMDELVVILGSDPPRKTDLAAERFTLKDGVGYWDGKPAIRFVGRGLATLRLMSSLVHSPYKYKYYHDSSSVMAFDDEGGTKEALVLTTDYEFLEYLARRLHITIRG